MVGCPTVPLLSKCFHTVQVRDLWPHFSGPLQPVISDTGAPVTSRKRHRDHAKVAS